MTVDAQAPQVLTDYYRRRAAEAPTSPAYFSLASGNWTAITWADFMRGAERSARRLAGLGLGADARLGLMAPTGLDWETLQVGALLCGAAVVGLDAHDQPARLADIVDTSGLTGLVVGDAAAWARIPAEACTKLSFVLCLNDDPVPPTCSVRWVRRSVFDAFDGIEPAGAPSPQSVATIIFTSGSTGAPKGIAYTHAQVCAAVAGILDAFPEITASDRLVCWLPLSNLFQRMINFCAAGRGAQTWFVADPRTIMTHLPTIQPHVFIAVPRFFEKLNEGIEQTLATRPASARKLVAWATAVGERAAQARRAGTAPGLFTRLQLPLAERLVLKRLRAILGGNIRFMVSGSAPFPRWLLERFHALGLQVLEAYGLSENVVPIAINRVTDYEFGTVGRVLGGNEVRIAEDDEVLVRGTGVFAGYLRQAGDDSPVDADGFLHTGDLGEFAASGRLRLTGRKSEVFKTSTGRKIAPTAVEARLKQIAGIDHVVVFGAAHKAIVALIVPTPDLLPGLANESAFAAWARGLATQVREVMADAADYLRPAGLLVYRGVFTIDSGELTSNLKLRRKVIEDRHRAALDVLFTQLERTNSGEFTERAAPDTLMINC
jgi:long-chain acyl-CoA synthetase